MTLDLCSSPIGGISRVFRRSSTYCPHGSRRLRQFSSTDRPIALSTAPADPLDDIENRPGEKRSQPYGSTINECLRNYRERRTIIDRREVGIKRWVFSTKRPRIDIAICGLTIPDASASFRSDLPSIPGTRANRALRLVLIYASGCCV